MAIPAYSSKGTSADTNTDACSGTWDVAPTCPGTVNAGDILVLIAVVRTFAGIIDSASPPSGWSSLNSVGIGTNRVVALFYKVASGSEGGSTATVTGFFSASGMSGDAQIFSFTGSGTGGVVPGSGTTNTGTSSAATMSNVTTTAANSLAVCFVVSELSIAEATGESGGNWVKPVATESLTVVNISVQTADMASVGTISGGTATLGGSIKWDTISFEIKEAASSKAPPPPRSPLNHLQHMLIR